ncbi:MAG: hypothetical protein ACRD29_05415 [Acidimicrobiales bacterium]
MLLVWALHSRMLAKAARAGAAARAGSFEPALAASSTLPILPVRATRR